MQIISRWARARLTQTGRQRHLCGEALFVGELPWVTGKARELQQNPESCNESLFRKNTEKTATWSQVLRKKIEPMVR